MTKHGTKIEWTHLPGYKGESWNPVGGCSHASSGCKNCYAERLAARLQAQKHPVYDGVISSSKRGPKFNGTVTAAPLDHPVWTQPLRWKKPRAIFVADMSDLFHEDRPDEHIDRVMAVAALCPQHIFMVLTKRPERMRRYMLADDVQHRIARAMDDIEVRREIAALPEEWRDVPGFPGYCASNHGRVSGPRGELSPDIGEQGHCRVTLYLDGARHRVSLHRLILTLFDRKPTDGEQVRHRNGDATCNALPNLFWGLQDANWDDAKRHGSHRRYSKLSPDDVIAIRRRAAGGEAAYSIAKDYPVSDTQVRNIVSGGQWSTEAGIPWPIRGVWLGTSLEDRNTGKARTTELALTPAAIRFWSVEPLLEDLGNMTGLGLLDTIDGERKAVDWVIAGGESGPRARPMHPDWVRSIRDQCDAAGVAFFMKQWGQYRPAGPMEPASHGIFPDGRFYRAGHIMNPYGAEGSQIARRHAGEEWACLVRVGKSAAGALLDGREHREFPEVRA